MSQINIGEDQLVPLIDFLQDNAVGNGDVLLTQQGDSLYVATDLASAMISPDGDVDES